MNVESAIINVLKPPGMTSHDVVDYVRKLTGQRRVGHAGTLDPSAAGVLVVMVGRATRLSRYLVDYDKRYRFELTFGLGTDTGDADGEKVQQADARHVTEERVWQAVEGLKGIFRMKPHRFSAAKIGGRKAYEIARQGQEPELQERAVAIHELRLLSFSPGERATGLFEVHCGKGTYVRSLATIIGQRVGSCAFASFVLRIQIGPFSVSDACTLEELEALSRERRLLDIAVSESYALSGYPSVNTTPDQARLLIHGNAIPLLTRYHPGQILVAYDSDGNLVAIGEARGTRPQMLQPRTVVAGGR